MTSDRNISTNSGENKRGNNQRTTVLLDWESGWLADERLNAWILKSWEASLREVTETVSVDMVPRPPNSDLPYIGLLSTAIQPASK